MPPAPTLLSVGSSPPRAALLPEAQQNPQSLPHPHPHCYQAASPLSPSRNLRLSSQAWLWGLGQDLGWAPPPTTSRSKVKAFSVLRRPVAPLRPLTARRRRAGYGSAVWALLFPENLPRHVEPRKARQDSTLDMTRPGDPNPRGVQGRASEGDLSWSTGITGQGAWEGKKEMRGVRGGRARREGRPLEGS